MPPPRLDGEILPRRDILHANRPPKPKHPTLPLAICRHRKCPGRHRHVPDPRARARSWPRGEMRRSRARRGEPTGRCVVHCLINFAMACLCRSLRDRFRDNAQGEPPSEEQFATGSSKGNRVWAEGARGTKGAGARRHQRLARGSHARAGNIVRPLFCESELTREISRWLGSPSILRGF